MSALLDIPIFERTSSLPMPNLTPSPASTASNSRSASRSSSYGAPALKQLVYGGQRVNVVLPSAIPDLAEWIGDVLLKVKSIHRFDLGDDALAITKDAFPNPTDKGNMKTSFPDIGEWDEYLSNLREAQILELGVVRVSPAPGQPFVKHAPSQPPANSIHPMNHAISPMIPFSPAFSSPSLHPHLQHQMFAHPSSTALPPPADWTWSSLGVVTPHHRQTQPQLPDWSVAAVKGGSPDRPNCRPDDALEQESPSFKNKKRGHDSEDTLSNNPDGLTSEERPDTKKQQLPSPEGTAPKVSKRPPFPFSVSRPAKTTQSKPSTGTISSTLNPFAAEFVFRPPESAPKLGATQKELSPTHLQESSKTLFNVFAPEFNPSKPSAIFGSNGVFLNRGVSFGQLASNPSFRPPIFVKPSPTKKTIPIVAPTQLESSMPPTEDMSEDDLSHKAPAEQDKANRHIAPAESSPNIRREQLLEKLRMRVEARQNSQRKESIEHEGSSSEGESTNESVRTLKAISEVNTVSPDQGKSHHYLPETTAQDISNSSDGDDCSQSKRSRSETPTLRRPVPGVKSPMSGISTELDPSGSPEKEFNGYPAFWEQRLLKSEQKAKRDRPLTPRGDVARSLANEFLEIDDDDSDDVSDKENRILPEPGESFDESDDSTLESRRENIGRMRLISKRESLTQIEKLIKERLHPVLKGLESVQSGLQRLSNKDKEERLKEQGSDADDEDDQVTPKKRGVLSLERIKSAVVEVLRDEKELFATPVIVEAGAAGKEFKELRATVDSLKSKLLNAEDNLDREQRRRTEVERNVEILSRDLVQTEHNLDAKTEQVKDAESRFRNLQQDYERAKKGWEDERVAHEKLDEVLKGIRGSLGQLTDKASKLSLEVTTLQSLNSSQKDEISTLREEVSKARGENSKLARERLRLEQELVVERGRFATLQNELMETGKAVAEQETRWREELGTERLRAQSLESNLADETRRVKKMEEECEQLAKIAEERGKLKLMVEASVARERDLETAKEALERRVFTAEAQAQVIKNERSWLEKDRQMQFENERRLLNADISSLRETVKTLQEEKIQAIAESQRQSAKALVQAEKIESVERELRHTTQSNLESLESKTRDLKDRDSQIASLQKDIIVLREKLDERDAQLESLREISDTARSDIVEKDKHILQLEFIIASTTSPTKRYYNDESYVKLQKREKEILRLRELIAALVQDNEDLAHSSEPLASEQQKKYNAMKNIVRAERERRRGLERELARLHIRDSVRNEPGRTPGSRSMSMFDTPASAVTGLDTPVSLDETPMSVRGFRAVTDTPLKGKGLLE